MCCSVTVKGEEWDFKFSSSLNNKITNFFRTDPILRSRKVEIYNFLQGKIQINDKI